MKLKRFLAAIAALCVLAAPAALAATAASDNGKAAPSPARARAAAVKARAAAVHRRAYRRHLRLVRQAERLRLRRFPRAYGRSARTRPTAALQRSNARLARSIRLERRYRAGVAGVPASTLRAIAACESGGNPRAIGGGGRYRGLFQMTFAIWSAVGGRGDPAAASVREQYYRAALIYKRYGSGQWPVCGR